MEKKDNKRAEAAIVAVGIVAGLLLQGVCLKAGIDNFVNKDRVVTVKGLSEKEVEADKVTWPIQVKEGGDDLKDLYARVNRQTATIHRFLTSNGIAATDIIINPPVVVDRMAENYVSTYVCRYNIKADVTVSSSNVKLVRELIARQGELLDQGVVINGNYDAPAVEYNYVSFTDMKPSMMAEAIQNAQKTAEQFAENSHSTLNGIVTAGQGQFSIEDRDVNTPHIKKMRVVTTITYALKD